jgi:hypothetical protein
MIAFATSLVDDANRRLGPGCITFSSASMPVSVLEPVHMFRPRFLRGKNCAVYGRDHELGSDHSMALCNAHLRHLWNLAIFRT